MGDPEPSNSGSDQLKNGGFGFATLVLIKKNVFLIMVRTVGTGTSSLSKLNTVPVPTIYLKKYSFDFFIVVVVGASQMGSHGAANSSLKQFEILLPYQYF